MTIKRKPRPKKAFVVCIDNSDYPASLELWKIYRILPDREGQKHGLVRVIDESGEDYLYPERRFKRITLPTSVRRLFKATVAA